MQLLSVNVSLGKEVPYKGKTVTTRIFKEPVNGRVMNRLLYFDPNNVEDAKRALCIDALSPGWRGSFEERLEKAGVSVEFIASPKTAHAVAHDQVPRPVVDALV